MQGVVCSDIFGIFGLQVSGMSQAGPAQGSWRCGCGDGGGRGPQAARVPAAASRRRPGQEQGGAR